MLKKTIQIITILIIFFITALTFYLYMPVQTSKIVYIPSGSSSYIIQTFINKGYNLTSFDKYLLHFIGKAQKGFIQLDKTKFTRIEFLKKLTDAKGATIDIIAPPGESTYFLIKKIAKELHLDENKLYKAYNQKAPFLDGVILSDTYKININMKEHEVISFLLKESMQKHKKISNKYLNSYNQKQWFKTITIASIIQKEAADIKEMPLVSSVIYNRLKKRMYLQMDGALNYGKYSHTKVTKKRLQKDKSLFNTYKYKGIPPYPVSIVNINAIKAALFPKKSNYLYFVIDKKTKKHIFSKTYKKHIKHTRSL